MASLIRTSVLLPLLAGVLDAPVAAGATLLVPGDYPTIGAALAVSIPGDVVDVACGTYVEAELNVPSGVTLRGPSPGEPCVEIRPRDAGGTYGVHCIDGSGAARVQGVRFYGGPRGAAVENAVVIFENCVFAENRGADGFYGGGLDVWGSSTVTVMECTFDTNVAASQDGFGSGAGMRVSGSVAIVTGTTFVGNFAGATASAMLFSGCPSARVESCVFRDNRTGHTGDGGAIALGTSTVMVHGCLFDGNDNYAGLTGGIFCSDTDSDVTVSHCTFHGNGRALAHYGAEGGPTAITVRNCLFSGSDRIHTHTPSAFVISCTNIQGSWGNLSERLGQDGNFSADPLFCDGAAGDYRLQWGSPCLPSNSGGCGLVGAYGFGACGSVAVDPSTWAKVKARFRP